MPPREVTQSASSSASPLPAASEVRPHAGGGLGVHGGDQLRRRMGRQHPVGVDRLPPLVLDGDHLGPAPRGDVDHPLAEQAVDRDDDDVARSDRVDECRLHAGRPGRRQRQGASVGRAEQLPEPVGRLVQNPQEDRVEVTQQRLAEGDRRLRVGVGRAGSEQGAGTQRHARDATGAAPWRPPGGPTGDAAAAPGRRSNPAPRRARSTRPPPRGPHRSSTSQPGAGTRSTP
jgi:hypothetical protein